MGVWRCSERIGFGASNGASDFLSYFAKLEHFYKFEYLGTIRDLCQDRQHPNGAQDRPTRAQNLEAKSKKIKKKQHP